MTLSDVIFRQEFKATVIFVFGLLLAVVMLFAGGDGSFWNKIHLFYFAVTGLCGYYIPLAVLFFGVVNVMNRQNNTYYFKAAELFVLLLIVCGLVHINTVADEAVAYGDAIKNVYNAVMDQKSSAVSNGGVFGAVCGGHMTLATPGAWAILLYLSFVSAAAYSLWANLLKHNPVSKVTVFGFLNPMCGVIISTIVLREDGAFGLPGFGALLLVCLGILIVNRGNASGGKGTPSP